jgi:hypothetical protein
MLEELFWAILITVTIIVFLFVILPSFFAGCTSAPVGPASAAIVGQSAQVAEAAAKAAHAAKAADAAKASEAKLNGYFSGVKTCVPEDYPRRPVGACPYAKAQSTDLPLANVPMCVAVGDQNMRLMPMSISA